MIRFSTAPFRALRRTPRLSLAAILCFAVGLAAVSAILTFARGILLRPLPFPESDRLVRVWGKDLTADRGRIPLSYPLMREIRTGVDSFEVFEATARSRILFFEGDGGRRVEGEAVTPGYFELLGLRPTVGRLFSPDEYEPGNEGVMVIGHDTWGSLFDYADDVAGRRIRTAEGVFEVIGVLPAGFTGTVEDDAGEIEFWLPIRHYLSEESRARWDVGQIWGIGRLAEGTVRRAAEDELAALAERLDRAHPEAHRGRTLAVEPMAENWREGLRGGTRLLFGAALGLLLVASLNVAALLLARSLVLRRDIAVHRAMGAPPSTLIRGALAEVAGLAAIGGLLGFALGQLLLPRILERATVALPDYVSPRADPVSTLLAFAILALAALLAGVIPAIAAARVDPSLVLKEGGRGASGSRASRRIWTALVVSELALTMALVFGSVVLLRSWQELRGEDLGFRTDGVARIGFFAGPEDAPEPDDVLPLARRVRDDLASRPGVRDVALLWPTVPIWSPVEEAVRWPSMPPSLHEAGLRVGMFAGDPGMFRLLELEPVAGRVLEDRDDGTEVAVVSRSLADRLGGPREALGSEIEISGGRVRVVGVVEDAKLGGAKEDDAHRYEMYLPLTLVNQRMVTLLVAADGVDSDALLPGLTARLGELAPHSALDWVGSMGYWLGERYKDSRFAPLLLGVFAVSAVLVAALGLFALLAASVEGRRREIAVRKALGASEARVLARILGRGVSLTVAGAAAGAAIAWLLSRFLAAFVYGVEVRDPWSFALAAALLALLGALAAGLPAWRGSRIDPMGALRDE